MKYANLNMASMPGDDHNLESTIAALEADGYHVVLTTAGPQGVSFPPELPVLRQMLAWSAMQGICASDPSLSAAEIVRAAVGLADALVKELDK